MGRERQLIVDTLLLGVVGALSAQAFTLMLRMAEAFFLTRLASYRPPGLPDEGGVLKQAIGPHGLWLIPVATTLGGLLGAAQVPIATLLMVTEMTGGYQLLVPAALAVMLSYLIQTKLSARSQPRLPSRQPMVLH